MTVEDFLKKWLGKQGAGERAEYQQFLTEFMQAIGVPTPGDEGHLVDDFRFEAPVKSQVVYGKSGTKRIDLYKRDHFILEAKQTRMTAGEAAAELPLPEAPPKPIHDLFGQIVGYEQPPARKLGRYDTLMADARIQAERYALALPEDHRTPPFLIVADIGRSFELYFDWAGNGRGYGPFPDERSYRIPLEALGSSDPVGTLKETALEVLRAIWTDPSSIDPRLRAAKVTRDIAERLSRVAAALEKEERDRNPGAVEIAMGIEQTSLFLMRMLFCMFAEDVELLPKDSFKTFLSDAKGRSDQFWRSGLHDLWSRMNDPQQVNRYWSYGDAIIRYFNGNLFSGARVYDLPSEFKNELLVAARQDWRSVEPAIFGTLLEQVLTAKDRAKLGAHYTPRAYVERLVQATIMDVLSPEWDAVLAAARDKADAGDAEGAIADARAFQQKLADLRVLDPACGTGNFLYVAMEQLLRLEGEVRQFAAGLGADLAPLIEPNQFLGLELNPRAAVIAELVLWIGWLRYRLANTPDAIGEPVLPPLSNINQGTHGGFDAVLVRTATGEPDVANPHRPVWPEADFIVGNPPFIGKGSMIREALGNDYVEALWAANPDVPKSADFVMQWWDRAADIVRKPGTRLKRFGLVTTNSIAQIFNRKVVEQHLQNGACLLMAVSDHPWVKAPKLTPGQKRSEAGPAAVRIAMTVVGPGAGQGTLVKVVEEEEIGDETPKIRVETDVGFISPRLRMAEDLPEPVSLQSNHGLCNTGMLLAGEGFKLSKLDADAICSQLPEDQSVIRPYVSGGEILGRSQGRFVIDFHGIDEREARQNYYPAYDHLLKNVYPVRSKNNDRARRERWWLFGRSNSLLRSQLSGIDKFIATTETAKHRVFQLISTKIVPDHMVISIGLSIYHFGVLSSSIHREWALEMGGSLEDRPRYNKTVCFDPYPFPDTTEAFERRVSELAAEMDDTRRVVLADNPKLTMTGLYNLVEEVRSGADLSPAKEAEVVAARARIVAKLHDDLDQAVADAYGWGDEWRRAPLPPGEIVARLARLNAERAAEEKAGTIRWLRPDYQIPRFGGA